MRKRSILLILLALMLTTGAASAAAEADSPVLSPAAQFHRIADAALHETYGLSRASLGLFNTEITLFGDAALATYTASGGVHPSLAGSYAVWMEGDAATACWTHDGVDAALWQSGDLSSPAWGEKQLQAFLASEARDGFCAPYLSDTARFTDAPTESAVLWQGEYVHPLLIEKAEGAMTRQQARQRAASALRLCFGIPEDEFSHAQAGDCELLLRRSGQLVWQVAWYMNTDTEYLFVVNLDAVTGEILTYHISTGGIG